MKFDELVSRVEDKTFIIAEAGVNHNGDKQMALDLIDAAAESGCDAVKFQTWITEKLLAANSPKPEYQTRTTGHQDSEFDTIKKLELKHEVFRELKAYSEKKGIIFFSTPDEIDSARYLAGIGTPIIKIGSGEVTNTPYLRELARLNLPIIYSTGACTLGELVAGAETILAENRQMMILHCVSSYPAPIDQMNLNFIPILKRMFGVPVGFSDHTTGVAAACAAVALGARIFEKHITLDKKLPGPDHQASLEPDEMRDYANAVRDARRALGDGVKRVMPCEADVRNAVRKFLVAARDLEAGIRLKAEDVIAKRLPGGVAPHLADVVVGARLTRAVKADAAISWDLLDLSLPQ
jgi:N,N'-diacetyllegionaminate synthase